MTTTTDYTDTPARPPIILTEWEEREYERIIGEARARRIAHYREDAPRQPTGDAPLRQKAVVLPPCQPMPRHREKGPAQPRKRKDARITGQGAGRPKAERVETPSERRTCARCLAAPVTPGPVAKYCAPCQPLAAQERRQKPIGTCARCKTDPCPNARAKYCAACQDAAWKAKHEESRRARIARNRIAMGTPKRVKRTVEEQREIWRKRATESRLKAQQREVA